MGVLVWRMWMSASGLAGCSAVLASYGGAATMNRTFSPGGRMPGRERGAARDACRNIAQEVAWHVTFVNVPPIRRTAPAQNAPKCHVIGFWPSENACRISKSLWNNSRTSVRLENRRGCKRNARVGRAPNAGRRMIGMPVNVAGVAERCMGFKEGKQVPGETRFERSRSRRRFRSILHMD